MRRPGLVAVAVVVLAGLTGCGDDGSAGPTSSSGGTLGTGATASGGSGGATGGGAGTGGLAMGGTGGAFAGGVGGTGGVLVGGSGGGTVTGGAGGNVGGAGGAPAGGSSGIGSTGGAGVVWYCQNAEEAGWAACYCATTELADSLPTCTRTFTCCALLANWCQCLDYTEEQCQTEVLDVDPTIVRVPSCPP